MSNFSKLLFSQQNSISGLKSLLPKIANTIRELYLLCEKKTSSKALIFQLGSKDKSIDMTDSQNRDEQIKKLRQLIKDIDIGMLTTVDEDGTLHSRPMSTNSEVEFDGDLWFFTYGSSHKVIEIEHQKQVNVSFSDPHKQNYVSVSGQAELVRDRTKLQQLWKPQLKAWFPKELDEPDIALLKVHVQKAEYWDAPSGFVAHTIGLVKAIATGEKANVGENQKVTLKS